MSLPSTRSIQDELWSRSKRIQVPLRATFANRQRSFDEQNRQLLSDKATLSRVLVADQTIQGPNQAGDAGGRPSAADGLKSETAKGCHKVFDLAGRRGFAGFKIAFNA